MIDPSDSQWAAIKAAKTWFSNPDSQQCFRLFGPAGSGKTEIALFIIRELGLELSDVAAMCFTGKATTVLAKRGFWAASTIHSSIYQPMPKGRGRVEALQSQLQQLITEGAEYQLIERVEKELRDEIRGVSVMGWMLKMDSPVREAKLVLIDEVSMVSADLAEDLLSFGVKILVLGDPYQLPPVAGTGYFTEAQPDALLTEIHRQAKDSAVIRMATMARETGHVPLGIYEDPSGHHSEVVRSADPERVLACDQVLVGHNATRHKMNMFVRGRRGIRSPLPVSDDRLMCMKNNKTLNIMNGGLYTSLSDAVVVSDNTCQIDFSYDDFPNMEPASCLAHVQVFGGDMKSLPPWTWEECEAFDYAYAVTTHKFQGSQAPHICVRAEWSNKDTWKRWYYTALTRAQISNYVVI